MQTTIPAAAPAVQITARDLSAGTVQHPQQEGQPGFFQQLLQQLSGKGQGSSANLSALSQLLSAAGAEDDQSEEGLLLAAELMAQMLALPPGELASLLIQSGGNEQALLEAIGAERHPVILYDHRLQEAATPANPLPQQEAQPQQQPFEVLLGSQATPAETPQQGEQMQSQANFQTAVNEAQRLIKTQPETKEAAQEQDIDSLQKKVDAQRAAAQAPATAQPRTVFGAELAKTEAAPASGNDLLGQVTTGIIRNLGDGKSEFVIRLKPEGLGEITVKMLAEGGKTTLSILTSSLQTQRLLNSELSGLREALRPLNAEVKEVVSNSPDFNFFHQNDRAYDGRQQRSFYHGGSANPHLEEADPFAADSSLLMHQQLVASYRILNRYV